MPSIRRNIWFRLRLFFNKIRILKYSLGTDILTDFGYYNLPWSPCTSTDTFFPGDDNIVPLYKGFKLVARRLTLPMVVSCGKRELTLYHEGAVITTIGKEMDGRTFLYGRFDYKVKMNRNPNVICAVWFLTKTRQVITGPGVSVESILPEIDWPESGTSQHPDRINMSLITGTLYDGSGYKIFGNNFKVPIMYSGHYWLEWYPGKLVFGYEDHIVAVQTQMVPSEPIYPIIWIAVPKWSDGIPEGHEEEFIITEFTYHK